MTPLDTLRALYAKEEYFANTLEQDIETHRRVGYVLQCDDFMLIWRRCELSWTLEQLRDPGLTSKTGSLAWIWAFAAINPESIRNAGRVAFRICNWAQAVGWDRRGKPKLIEADVLKKLLNVRPALSAENEGDIPVADTVFFR